MMVERTDTAGAITTVVDAAAVVAADAIDAADAILQVAIGAGRPCACE